MKKPRFCKLFLATGLLGASAFALAQAPGGELPKTKPGDPTTDIYGPAAAKESDAEIQRNVEEALRLAPYLKSREHLKVSVDNQVVRLSGTVDSKLEKFEAEDSARQVKGVRDVKNDIQIAKGGG